jgi:hypothetical protein
MMPCIISNASTCSAGLQYLLPSSWTALFRTYGTPIAGKEGKEKEAAMATTHTLIRRLSDALSTQPAVLAGLDGRKGKIAPGYEADFVVGVTAFNDCRRDSCQ